MAAKTTGGEDNEKMVARKQRRQEDGKQGEDSNKMAKVTRGQRMTRRWKMTVAREAKMTVKMMVAREAKMTTQIYE